MNAFVNAPYQLGLACLISTALSLAHALPAYAQGVSLATIETQELLLITGGSEAPAQLPPQAAKSFLNALAFHQSLFGWQSDEKIAFLFKDWSDRGNASAIPVPRNLILSEMSPMSKTFESSPPIDQIFNIMNHEVAHLATLDAHGERQQFWRDIFGGKVNYTASHPETLLYGQLTAPRVMAPAWLLEGLATFMDTWMSGGIGRGQGGYDEMIFRAMVRDDARFYTPLGLESEGTKVDINSGSSSYLYGTRFMTYLAYTYSPEMLIKWFKLGEGDKPRYVDQFKHVFGLSVEQAWDEWIAFEHDFQAQNLVRLQQFPPTRGEPLSARGVGWVSRVFLDEASDSFVGGFYAQGTLASLGKYAFKPATAVGDKAMPDASIAASPSPRLESVYVLKGPSKFDVTSTAFDPVDRILYFTEDNARFRDIKAWDLASDEIRTIGENVRTGELVFNQQDRSLWGIKHSGSKASLVHMPYPYEKIVTIYTMPYAHTLSDLDISIDGRLMSATVGDRQGNQALQVFKVSDLMTRKVSPVTEFDFGMAFPEDFVFDKAGKYLYGTSYYTGVSNVFRFEIATGDMEAITNAETGFFRPMPMDDGSLMVFEYTGDGFLPTLLSDPVPLQDLSAISFFGSELVKKHPVIGTWGAGSPDRIDLAPKIISEAAYEPFNRIAFETAYPMVEGYKDSGALGYAARWSDPLNLNSIELDLSYSIDDTLDTNEKLHADLTYHHMDWQLRYWHNDADFYDLFGPTKRSRKGDAFIVSYKTPLTYDPPKRLDLSADLAYYTGLDTLPVNQNIETGINKMWSGNVGLSYSDVRQSQGAVDDEKGIAWQAQTMADYADGTFYPKLKLGLNLGFELPIKHSSVWLYNTAGAAEGNRADVFTNYYFGGFGNNTIDDGSVKRYRGSSSMPGFEIGEISGRSFAKSLLELNLPPIRFNEVGSQSFYLSHIRPAIFAGALMTDPGNAFEETYGTVGAQIDLSFTMLYRLPMTISLGVAQGIASGNRGDTEWMLSLKIM